MGRKARPRTVMAVGKTLPNLTAPATGNRAIRLTDLKGKPLVVYFYPKDETPGCTLEGHDFRDRYEQFKNLDAEVLGVSRDSIASHEKFKAKHNLPFELVSDENEMLCRQFGVIKNKKLYGRAYRGIERSTFIFDRDGLLRKEIRGVKVAGHVVQVLEEIAKL